MQKQNPDTANKPWGDLFFALFWLETGLALMYTRDGAGVGGLLIGLWMGRYM